jgi:hypothetical protein
MQTTSILEQYRIADFLEWHQRKQLELNPYFQRRSVWTQQAKVLLIDTILRRLPIPKIYMRTKIDPASKVSYREVVDGQQRLRAIINFAEDGFAMTPRTKEFSGLRYSSLPADLQEAFLTYPMAVDQLINATDTDVLEIFSRLNSYTVILVPAEKRHAKFQGNFKWAVHDAAKGWPVLWEKYRIVSVHERLRMADDSLMAEMFGVILQGVTDGGAPKIDRLYRTYEEQFDETETRSAVDDTLSFMTESLDDVLLGTPLSRSPQFLMLFAAVAHARRGIPAGQIGDGMPPHDPQALAVLDRTRIKLAELGSLLEQDEPPTDSSLAPFWRASSQSTQRIATRRVRFLTYWNALLLPVNE